MVTQGGNGGWWDVAVLLLSVLDPQPSEKPGLVVKISAKTKCRNMNSVMHACMRANIHSLTAHVRMYIQLQLSTRPATG